MSAHESKGTFDELLVAHANRELESEGRRRLADLAAADPERRAELGSVDDALRRFGGERELMRSVTGPLTEREVADPSFRRLRETAAQVQQGLRGGLLAAGASAPRAVRQRSSMWWAGAAGLLAAGALVFFLLGSPRQPDLQTGPPGDAVLGGGARITMRTDLRVDRPVFDWHACVGAARYSAVVVDTAGDPSGGSTEVLRRADDSGASTRWELTSAQLDVLRRRVGAGADLRLRVVAFDGVGTRIASTGDLPLQLIE